MNGAGPGARSPVIRAPLVLASASPRRRELLAQIGIVPDRVAAADLDEAPLARELPRDHALRLAEAKARAIAGENPDALVLGADTVVALGRRILPKADDEATARQCLMRLSGRRHRVLGGVCIVAPGGIVRTRLVTSVVGFKQLAAAEIAAYLASGEWRGKAGGYAIQGRAAAFVRFLSGSYSNVVGLPLFETAQLLDGLGYRAAAQP
jgi:septum formation protein